MFFKFINSEILVQLNHSSIDYFISQFIEFSESHVGGLRGKVGFYFQKEKYT